MFWIHFFIDVLIALFVVVCPLMWLVILMQRSKQEGLGAAFGGGFTESVWGAQTSNVLVKSTVVLAATFFIVSILLARLYTLQAGSVQNPSSLQQDLLRPVTPMTPTNSAGSPVVPTATPLSPAVANPPATNSPAAVAKPVPAPDAKTPAAK
jgi:preprotein translocase subunit SecG